jgi:hypothetical protein
MFKLTFALKLSYLPLNIGCHLGCHLDLDLTLILTSSVNGTINAGIALAHTKVLGSSIP